MPVLRRGLMFVFFVSPNPESRRTFASQPPLVSPIPPLPRTSFSVVFLFFEGSLSRCGFLSGRRAVCRRNPCPSVLFPPWESVQSGFRSPLLSQSRLNDAKVFVLVFSLIFLYFFVFCFSFCLTLPHPGSFFSPISKNLSFGHTAVSVAAFPPLPFSVSH